MSADGPKILCVDDDLMFLSSLMRLLRQLPGVSVDKAMSVAAAREQVKNEDYAVVITDQRMPGGSGVDLLEYVAQTCPETVSVLTTAFSEEQVLIEAINRGHAFAFLRKPSTREELMLTVQRALERHDMGKTLKRKVAELEQSNAKLERQNKQLSALVNEESVLHQDSPSSITKEHFEAILNQRKFHMVYQPVVDLHTAKIFSYEALLRSDDAAIKSPIELLDASILHGYCGEFGRFIREQALENSPDHPLFLNIHPVELGEGWLVRPDDPIFQHDQQIFLEITESVPLSHFALCEGILSEVRGRGVKVAVDDLGAGYSNLKYIGDLAPEVVKLDRDLITNLHQSARHQRLVKAIVRLCNDVEALVVAEGIETLDEFHAVRDAGAQLGQGYLLARPDYPAPAVNWPE